MQLIQEFKRKKAMDNLGGQVKPLDILCIFLRNWPFQCDPRFAHQTCLRAEKFQSLLLISKKTEQSQK
jgi:hypothetical protein